MNAHYEKLLEGLENEGFTKFGSLDSGSYSNVLSALSPSGERVAVKLFTADVWASGISDHFVRELRCMAALRHPNIVALRAAYVCGPAVALCTPLYTTTLYKYIQSVSVSKKQIPLPVVKHIMRSIAQGIKFAHDNGFAHRDLKPGNVFINSSSLSVAVGDWGLARRISDVTPSELSPDVISTWYAPPEVLCKSKRYGASADIWSLGIILLDLLNGKHIFNGDKRNVFVDKIIALLGTATFSVEECIFLTHLTRKNVCLMPKRPSQLCDVLSKWSFHPAEAAAVSDLLSGMLAILPSKRLTCEAVLAHPFFSCTSAVDLEAGSLDMDAFRADTSLLRRGVFPPPIPASLTCHETLSAPYEDDPAHGVVTRPADVARVVTILPRAESRSSSSPAASSLKRPRASALTECSWHPGCTYSDRFKLIAFLSRLDCFSSSALAAAMHLSHQLSAEQCDQKHMFACYTLCHVAIRPVFELMHLREDDYATCRIPKLLGSGVETIAELSDCEKDVLVAAGGNIPSAPQWLSSLGCLEKNQVALACLLASVPDLALEVCNVYDADDLRSFVSADVSKRETASELNALYNHFASFNISCSYFPKPLTT